MLKFNKHLAKVHAYLCADGYVIKSDKVGRKYYYIGFRNYKNTLLTDFDNHFEAYFDIKPRRMSDGRSVVQNKEIILKLIENDSYYSLDWKIPKLTKRLSTYWLQAYFDCEAWVLIQEAQSRLIGVDSINKSGLLSIQTHLKKLGINSKVQLGRSNIPNRNDIYRLFIYGKENLKKFQRKINFFHTIKKLKLQRAIESYVDRNWKISPSECGNQEKAVREMLSMKNGFKKRGTYSICSMKRYNLVHLKKFLQKELKIDSRISPLRTNPAGSKFYEFTINNKDHVKKLKNFIYPQ